MNYFTLIIVLVVICTLSCVSAEDNETVDDFSIVDNNEEVLIEINDENAQNGIANESIMVDESNISTRGVKLHTTIDGEDYVLNHNPMPYIVYLKDIYGNPLSGLTVTFNINGVNYNRATATDGSARLNINLPLGNYSIMYSFAGSTDYYASSGSSMIFIVDYKLSSSFQANDLTKYYGDSDAYVIYLKDNNCNPLVGETLLLTVNSVTYYRTTGSNGEATLSINLLQGTYFLTVLYNGNNYYNGTSITNTVTVNRRATSIAGSDLRKYPEDTAPYTVILKDNLNNPLPNKSILITVNSISYSRTTDNNGFASLSINLPPGTYTITTVYDGDNYYMSSNLVNNIIIIKRTYLTGEDIVKYVSDDGQYIVYLKDYQNLPLTNRNINMSVNGLTYTRETNGSGYAHLNINLLAGTYTITSNYGGDLYYGSSTTFNTITVNKKTSMLVCSDLEMYYGDNNDFTAHLTDNNVAISNAEISFTVNGATYYRTTDSNGYVHLNINLLAGNYTITTNFSGNDYYMSDTVVNNIIINKKNSAITGADLIKYYGDTSPFTVNVYSTNNESVNIGKVLFVINNVSYLRNVNNGHSSLNINLPEGTYNITCNYVENDYYYSSNIIVHNIIINRKNTTLTVTSGNITKFYNETNYYTVKLTSDNNPIVGKTVDFIMENITFHEVSDDDGFVVFIDNFTQGSYQFNIVFNGDNYYHASNILSGEVIIDKKNISLVSDGDMIKYYGVSKPYNVTLISNNTPLVNKTIVFSINNINYTRRTDSNGMARLNINLPWGNYTITATFNGGEYYYSMTIVNNITILRYPTLLNGSNLTKYYGDSTPYIVSLTSNETPLNNRVIEMIINGATYYRTTNNDGNATLDINLPQGTYIITSKFYGDGVYADSNTINSVIIIKRQTYFIANNFTKYYGENKRFMIKLVDNENQSIINTAIHLTINSIQYTRITDDEGNAYLNINLPVGEYDLIANYEGNATYDSCIAVYDVQVFNLIYTEFKNITTHIYGSNLFRFSLVDNFNFPMINQTVNVIIGNSTFNVITNSEGIGSLLLSVPPGIWNVSLEYDGWDIYHSAYASGFVEINIDCKKINSTDIISVAAYLKNYYNANHSLPNCIQINDTNLSIFELSYAMASLINMIDNNITGEVLIPYINNTNYNVMANTNKILSKYTYMNFIKDLLYYTEINGYIPLSLYSSFATIDFTTYTYSFSNILSFYDSCRFLPSNINFNNDSSYFEINNGDDLNNLTQWGNGLNEYNYESDISQYLVLDDIVTDEISSINNVLTGGLGSPLDKVESIFKYVNSMDYAFYYGSKGLDYILSNQRGNPIDKSKLISILCRLNNIPTKYNKGNVQFPSGNTYSHTWLQILIGNNWYVADATSSRNTFGTVNNWNTSNINSLEQGNFYDNTTPVQINNLNQGNYNNTTFLQINNLEQGNYYNTTLNNLESMNLDFNNSSNLILTNGHYPFIKLNCTLSFNATSNNYIIAYLKDTDNSPLINKFIMISINDTILTFCTDFEGCANLGHYNAGIYTINGTFTGDDKYNSYTNATMIELNKISTSIKILNNIIPTDDVLSILLIDNNSLPLSNFNLNIMINNSVYNVISDDYGGILFNHNLSVGDYNVNCIFNGDNNYYSTQFSFILKIREKTKINSVQSILLKSDSFNVCLMDVNNTPLSNRNINVTFHDSTFNLYCNTCETTDNEGFICVSSPNNGVNTISFSFGGDEYYLRSYYSTIVYDANSNEHFESTIYFEDAYNKAINIHNKGDYLVGRLVDSLYNPIKNSLVNISILYNGINVANYVRFSDDEGRFRLKINYDPVNLIIICKYLGDDKYASCIGTVSLNVTHGPDFVYSINITTLDKTSDGLLIPYGREIGVYKNNNVYKFGYGYASTDVTALNDDYLYFISFDDNEGIHEIDSINVITSSGILLYANNGYVSIRYYGYFTNLTNFNAIFDGKQYYGKYISNVTLLQNNIIVGSFYFSSEIFTQHTQEYLYDQLNQYYYEYKVYSPVMTNLIIFNYGEINSTFWENLYYGDTTYRNDYIDRGWNNSLGYEAVESFVFMGQEYISDTMMSNAMGEYNNYGGANKVVYEAYLTCLAYNWLCDKFSSQIGDKYGVNLIKRGYSLTGAHFGLSGRLFDNHDNLKFHGDGYCSYLANNEYSLMASLLEQFVVSLHGGEATCAVSEIIKAMINGEDYSFILSDNNFIIRLDDNSSELVFHTDGGVTSYIFPNVLDEKYDLNGGKSLSNYSFSDLSEIFDNLMDMLENFKSPHSLAEYIVHSLNWDEDAIPVCEFIIGISASIIGFELMTLGVVVTGASGGLGIIGGILIVGAGAGLIAWSDNIGENPYNLEGWAFFIVDMITWGVASKVTRFVRAAGSIDMGITSKLFVTSTRESFDTSVSDTTKSIIDYYDIFNIDMGDLYNDFIEFLEDICD